MVTQQPSGQTVTVQPFGRGQGAATQIPFLPDSAATILNTSSSITVELCPVQDFASGVVPLGPGGQISWPQGPLYARVPDNTTADLTVIDGIQTYFAGSIQTAPTAGLLIDQQVNYDAGIGEISVRGIPIPTIVSSIIVELIGPLSVIDYQLVLVGEQSGLNYCFRKEDAFSNPTGATAQYTWVVAVPTGVDRTFWFQFRPSAGTGFLIPQLRVFGTSEDLNAGLILNSGYQSALPYGVAVREDGVPYPGNMAKTRVLSGFFNAPGTFNYIPAAPPGARILLSSLFMQCSSNTGAAVQVSMFLTLQQLVTMFSPGVSPQVIPPQGLALDPFTGVQVIVVGANVVTVNAIYQILTFPLGS